MTICISAFSIQINADFLLWASKQPTKEKEKTLQSTLLIKFPKKKCLLLVWFFKLTMHIDFIAISAFLAVFLNLV